MISLSKVLRTVTLGFVALCVSASLSYAAAGKSCYTMDEAEAEQGIRIHSELMIIGLNCSHIRQVGGSSLFSKYRQFTSSHKDLFEYYEGKLMDYFERTGSRNPEKELNSMRTDFANTLANDVAQMRPDVFCHRYAKRIDEVSGLTTSNIRKWASTFYSSHPVSNPICSQ